MNESSLAINAGFGLKPLPHGGLLPCKIARMFIQYLQTNPWFYFSVLVAVIISIVLHELAHGWAAIWQGDDTPRRLGHITLNPLTHMGWMSLGVLAVVGIAWGMMPVNPQRFRSRYSDALVSAAGPGMNLLLAILALSAVGVMERMEVRQMREELMGHDFRSMSAVAVQSAEAATQEHAATSSSQPEQAHATLTHNRPVYRDNAIRFLTILGTMNLVLMMFNLIPLPPLDGSTILANFNHRYAQWIYDPQKKTLLMGMFILVFFFSKYLFDVAANLRDTYLIWIVGL